MINELLNKLKESNFLNNEKIDRIIYQDIISYIRFHFNYDITIMPYANKDYKDPNLYFYEIYNRNDHSKIVSDIDYIDYYDAVYEAIVWWLNNKYITTK